MDYRDAGVDIQAGRDFVNRIKALVQQTTRSEVLGGLGGFGGCFQLPEGYRQPVLVSGADGVGTKLKIAQALNQHHTIGIDLVAMCVNDVLTCGAEPLFFLDYLATGHLEPEALTDVIAGIAQGCQQAGCALLGGETAEMPGFYPAGEYDLAGFCVGIVEKAEMLNGSQVRIGDRAIGLASSGVHSNGYSLVRKIVDEFIGPAAGEKPEAGVTEAVLSPWSITPWTEREDLPLVARQQSLGEALLTPTQIYVKPVLAAQRSGLTLHGMAHITGGGLPENLPRCLGKDQSVQIDPQSWPAPPIFDWIASTGSVPTAAMFDTFNMGIGFVLIVPPEKVESALHWFNARQCPAYEIGEVVVGAGEVLGLPG